MGTFRRTKGHVASRRALPFGALVAVASAGPWYGATPAVALEGLPEDPPATSVEGDLLEEMSQVLEVVVVDEAPEEPDGGQPRPDDGDPVPEEPAPREASPAAPSVPTVPAPAPDAPVRAAGGAGAVDTSRPPAPDEQGGAVPPAAPAEEPPPRPRSTALLAEQLYALALPPSPAGTTPSRVASVTAAANATTPTSGLASAAPLAVAAIGGAVAGRSLLRSRRRTPWRRGLPGLPDTAERGGR